MSILCPFDMWIHGINIQLNGAKSIDISFLRNLQIRLIPVRSRVRISPLLFFVSSRVIRRALFFQNPIGFLEGFLESLLGRTAPSRQNLPIGVTFDSALSLRSNWIILPSWYLTTIPEDDLKTNLALAIFCALYFLCTFFFIPHSPLLYVHFLGYSSIKHKLSIV